MRCPLCGKNDVGTVDSRKTPTSVRRRRLCRACGYRWSTLEVAERPKSEEDRLVQTMGILLYREGAGALKKRIEEVLCSLEAKMTDLL